MEPLEKEALHGDGQGQRAVGGHLRREAGSSWGKIDWLKGHRELNGPWPWCLGKTGEVCKAHIECKGPGLKLIILPPDSFTTMDFNYQRVWIRVDSQGIVKSIPRRG